MTDSQLAKGMAGTIHPTNLLSGEVPACNQPNVTSKGDNCLAALCPDDMDTVLIGRGPWHAPPLDRKPTLCLA